MKIETSEAEIIGLLTKTEEERILWLSNNNLIDSQPCPVCESNCFISLPDLAERLWGKAVKINENMTILAETMTAVYKVVSGDAEIYYCDVKCWFCYFAKPIQNGFE
jgi:hypothetical protein